MISAVNGMAFRTAFVSVASRMVGASFRVGEAYNPGLRKSGATLDPQVILNRELVGLALAWVFSFAASKFSSPLVRRFNLSAQWVTFAITLLGNALAETISRVIAYRKKAVPAPVSGPDRFVRNSLPAHPRQYSPGQARAMTPFPVRVRYPGPLAGMGEDDD